MAIYSSKSASGQGTITRPRLRPSTFRIGFTRGIHILVMISMMVTQFGFAFEDASASDATGSDLPGVGAEIDNRDIALPDPQPHHIPVEQTTTCATT
jgi:hypothetical protein